MPYYIFNIALIIFIIHKKFNNKYIIIEISNFNSLFVKIILPISSLYYILTSITNLINLIS